MVPTSTPGGLMTTVVSGRKPCFSRQPQLEWIPTPQSMFVLIDYLFIYYENRTHNCYFTESILLHFTAVTHAMYVCYTVFC